jgi:hypothetical protein
LFSKIPSRLLKTRNSKHQNRLPLIEKREEKQRETARIYPSKVWQIDGRSLLSKSYFLEDLHKPASMVVRSLWANTPLCSRRPQSFSSCRSPRTNQASPDLLGSVQVHSPTGQLTDSSGVGVSNR